MKKIDLIIDELEMAENKVESAYVAIHIDEALAAARELRDMKPVGIFEYDTENKVWEELMEGSEEGTPLYALEQP